MAQATGQESIEVHLNYFSEFYGDFMNLRSFEGLELAIGDSEAKIGSQPDISKAECMELLDGMLGAAKQTRRELTADLSELHHRLSLVLFGLETDKDDTEGLMVKIKAINRWLVELQVTVKRKAIKRDVEKYFEELERMREELLKISDGTEDIAKTFFRTLENERKLKKQVEQDSLKLEKTEEKYKKARSAYDDLKVSYNELFKRHDALLKQNAILKEKVVGNLSSLSTIEKKRRLPQVLRKFGLTLKSLRSGTKISLISTRE